MARRIQDDAALQLLKMILRAPGVTRVIPQMGRDSRETLMDLPKCRMAGYLEPTAYEQTWHYSHPESFVAPIKIAPE